MDFPLAVITSRSREEGATLPSLSRYSIPTSTEQSCSIPNDTRQGPDYGPSAGHRPRSTSSDTRPSTTRGPQDSVNEDDVGFSLAANNLPPADHGFPNSFGVFLGYYSRMFREDPGAELLLPLAGTLCSGLIYCSGPILYPIMARYPSHRRTSMWAGNIICFGCLFGASFVNKPWQIVLLQGGGYGLGGSLLYAPTVSYMSEWFFSRRGLANGVMNAGTAVGGLVLPLILPSIIRPHGIAKTLRYLAITVFTLLSAVLPFIRPRLPEDRVHHLAQGSKTKWITNKSFWLLLLVTTLQGFAYFLPIVYLPTFAQDMKLNDNQASLAVALLNGSSVISRVSMGLLSDRFSPWVLSTLTLAATSATTFVLWGAVTTTLVTLSVYAVLFGALAGGFSSLWTGFVRPIAKDDTSAATSMLGMLMLSRGLGNVLSTPISSALISGPMRGYVRFGLQNGSRWSSLIIYVGTVFAGATLTGLFGYLRERRPVAARLAQS